MIYDVKEIIFSGLTHATLWALYSVSREWRADVTTYIMTVYEVLNVGRYLGLCCAAEYAFELEYDDKAELVTQKIYNTIVMRGTLEDLLWIEDYDLIPPYDIMHKLASRGDVGMFLYMYNYCIGRHLFLDDVEAPDFHTGICAANNIGILKALRERKVYLDPVIALYASRAGNVEVVKFICRLGKINFSECLLVTRDSKMVNELVNLLD